MEYVGDAVLVLEGEHAGREGVLLGPDPDEAGWVVLVGTKHDGDVTINVGPDELEVVDG